VLVGGSLRAEVTLAVANVVWFVLLIAGGVGVPPEDLPRPLAIADAWLPSGALAHALSDLIVRHRPPPMVAVLVLAGWLGCARRGWVCTHISAAMRRHRGPPPALARRQLLHPGVDFLLPRIEAMDYSPPVRRAFNMLPRTEVTDPVAAAAAELNHSTGLWRRHLGLLLSCAYGAAASPLVTHSANLRVVSVGLLAYEAGAARRWLTNQQPRWLSDGSPRVLSPGTEPPGDDAALLEPRTRSIHCAGCPMGQRDTRCGPCCRKRIGAGLRG
jgi:hypothetical protein